MSPARRPPQIPFHRVFFKNKKGPGTNFQATFFKLAQFNCQAVFTSQVVFLIS